MKKVFVAATRQNDGKTMNSLGLFHSMLQRFPKGAYMKPVGQQYRVIDGKKIDKDAVLFYQTFKLKDPLQAMSPIAVPKGFTENYIQNPEQGLGEKIRGAYDALSQGKEFVLFEGTGHAGVGSVFDLSNAKVAKILDTKVIIVSVGGIGRSIDEIILNKSLFDREGVEILGVIINKVIPNKFEKISKVVRKGLERHGIPVLGVIPHVDSLGYPSVSDLAEDLDPEILSTNKHFHRPVERFMMGDMQPHNALDILTQHTIVIVPGNREALILTALCESMLNTNDTPVSGIIFTDGIKPHEKILDLLTKTDIPLLLVKEDAFTVATRINQMIVKIRSEDTNKIQTVQSLFGQYVDIDRICSAI